MTQVSDLTSSDRTDAAARAAPSDMPAAVPAPSEATAQRLAQLFRRCRGQPHPLQPILQAYRGVQP